MQKLSMSDAMFLYTESKEAPAHVAGLTIVQLPEGYEGSFHADYTQILKDRLHEVPIMQWRMEETPLELDYPRWVEVEDLDWDYHIRATSIARPGSDEQLWDKVARLHSQLLDRSKPLWEHHIIEGLAGNRVAVYSKIHHACVDGQAGQQVQQVLFDMTAEPRGPLSEDELKKFPFYRKTEKKAPGLLSTVATAAWENATKRPLLLETPKLINMARKALEKREELKDALPGSAPKTILNVPISGQRSFATGSVPLSAMKAVKNATGTTLNDVTVAICGGALRRFLEQKRALPAESLICGAPVALPQKGDSSNNVSMMMLPYHTEIADPIDRLNAVHEGAMKAKAATAAMLEVTGEGPDFTLPAGVARRAMS
ncbi:MAG: wax ester/triacylglycerol synthase domain-containing protein, partial [Alphaproteobacteria bacterium]